MGVLQYGGAEYEVDDRSLAHLKVVISEKLRRKETVALAWDLTVSEGSGRVEILVFPDSALTFRFGAATRPKLNRNWIRALRHLAAAKEGLRFISEEEAEAWCAEHDEHSF